MEQGNFDLGFIIYSDISDDEPSAWNALPEDIRATSDSAVFRNQLKTHYFSLAFNAC